MLISSKIHVISQRITGLKRNINCLLTSTVSLSAINSLNLTDVLTDNGCMSLQYPAYRNSGGHGASLIHDL